MTLEDQRRSKRRGKREPMVRKIFFRGEEVEGYVIGTRHLAECLGVCRSTVVDRMNVGTIPAPDIEILLGADRIWVWSEEQVKEMKENPTEAMKRFSNCSLRDRSIEAKAYRKAGYKIGEIVEVMGVSKRTIYRYLAMKDDEHAPYNPPEK